MWQRRGIFHECFRMKRNTWSSHRIILPKINMTGIVGRPTRSTRGSACSITLSPSLCPATCSHKRFIKCFFFCSRLSSKDTEQRPLTCCVMCNTWDCNTNKTNTCLHNRNGSVSDSSPVNWTNDNTCRNKGADSGDECVNGIHDYY